MSAAAEVVFEAWPYDVVRRGAELLTTWAPGWREEVDIEGDILFQVRLHYSIVMHKRGLRPWVAGHPFTYGFAVDGAPTFTRMKTLADAWLAEILDGVA